MQQSNHKESDNSNSDIKLKNRHSEASKRMNKNIDKNNKNYTFKQGRKHQRKNDSKKHEASNCGTKEPKGPSETHIEWEPEGKVCFKRCFHFFHFGLDF